FCNELSPPIHIFAGENVCIHATTPTQLPAVFASRQSCRIDSGLLTTGLCTTRTGIAASASSEPATSRACSSTWWSASSPYRSWLPVRNQTSCAPSAFPVAIERDPDRARARLIGCGHAVAPPREDRLGRLRDRLRSVGDRRRVGGDRRGGVPRGAARGGR